MPKFSGPELLIVLVVVLILFGASRLPKLARSLGASAKEFRKGIQQGSTEEEETPEDQTVDKTTEDQTVEKG